jgi:predicted esterase
MLRISSYIILWLFTIVSCSKEGKVTPIPLETPIRFQVSINTKNVIPGDTIASDTIDRYENDWGVLILPKAYQIGNSVPLIIGCHGGGGSVDGNTSQIESIELYKYLVSLGYAVMDMAGMPETYSNRKKIDHNRCMGSFIAISSYEMGYKWVIKNYNIDISGCYLSGGSNGGLTAANLAYHSDIPVICQAGMSPLLSMKGAWYITSGAISGGEFKKYQNRANIIRIYGLKNVSSLPELISAKYEQKKIGIFDPFNYMTNKVNGVETKSYPCPIKIFHPKNDPVVSIDSSRRFVNAITNNGGVAFLEELAGGYHSPETYGDSIGTFQYNGKKYYLKPAVYGLAQWFGEYSGIPAVFEPLN